jgi:hypothetical protein
MTDPGKKSRREVARAIDNSYWPLERLAERSMNTHRFWNIALKEAEKSEREHRAFGTRFTRGQARYKQPVKVAARYFLAKFTLEMLDELEANGPTAISWNEAASTRTEAMLCRAIAECLREDHQEQLAAIPRAVLTLDYSKDIADNE